MITLSSKTTIRSICPCTACPPTSPDISASASALRLNNDESSGKLITCSTASNKALISSVVKAAGLSKPASFIPIIAAIRLAAAHRLEAGKSGRISNKRCTKLPRNMAAFRLAVPKGMVASRGPVSDGVRGRAGIGSSSGTFSNQLGRGGARPAACGLALLLASGWPDTSRQVPSSNAYAPSQHWIVADALSYQLSFSTRLIF